MKPSKASLGLHMIGMFYFVASAITYFVFGQHIEVILLGLVGLTLIWLLALEKDVYEMKK